MMMIDDDDDDDPARTLLLQSKLSHMIDSFLRSLSLSLVIFSSSLFRSLSLLSIPSFSHYPLAGLSPSLSLVLRSRSLADALFRFRRPRKVHSCSRVIVNLLLKYFQ